MPDEHLTTEEISELLDRGAERTGESGHVDECAACRREMELLRRMRMALSALDDRQAPGGAWASIEGELEERGVVDRADEEDGAPGRTVASVVGDIGWLRAAAAVLLFAGGLGLGTVISSPDATPAGAGGELAAAGEPAGEAAEASAPGGSAPPSISSDEAAPAGAEESAAGATRSSDRARAGDGGSDVGPGGDSPAGSGVPLATVTRGPVDEAGSATPAGDLTYRQAMERLERLRDRGPTLPEAYRNPAAAAEHLARLDALMRASREALREDPADPALNDFLFRVAEERVAYNRALRLASLEYR